MKADRKYALFRYVKYFTRLTKRKGRISYIIIRLILTFTSAISFQLAQSKRAYFDRLCRGSISLDYTVHTEERFAFDCFSRLTK